LNAYFVKDRTNSKTKYTEDDIVNMINFLIDNIFIELEYWKNWRPITLLSNVYKIASGVIAARIKLYLSKLVHGDQAIIFYSIQKRRISQGYFY